jgi:hypothetical protein
MTTNLASSPKFKTFAIAFAIVGTILYVCCDIFGWPLFSFHPGTNRVEWGYGPPRLNEGPVMYWYGWVVTTLIGASVAGFLATLLPENTTKNIPLLLLWLLPVVAVPVMAYTLMPFWTK